MTLRRRKNLRILDGYKGDINKKIENLTSRFKINTLYMKTVLKFAAVFAGITVVCLIAYLQVYTESTTIETYRITGAADNNYEQFAEGVLKYSRDGISYLNSEGDEYWNLPYQIKTPFIEINGSTAAVADKGGNDILIFQEQGLKGEVQTALPIEKIAVSQQGIVCAILKNESAPQIICYDAAGNVLVEHKTSLSGMGYPMDVALSADGETLQVLYLQTDGGEIVSKAVYYDFGEDGEDKTDHQIMTKEYENTILATGFYVNEKTSAVIGDNCFSIFKTGSTVEEVVTINLDKEIQSVCHNEKYIAFALQNKGTGGCELRIYNTSGKQVMSEVFDGSYRNMKMADKQVIMYDGKTCCIFLKNGLKRFDGEMGNTIMEIFPMPGMNKYVVMTANGMEYVRLAK